MRVLIKPFTKDENGNDLMANIYNVIEDCGDKMIIEDITVNGKNTYIISKERVLKKLKDV